MEITNTQRNILKSAIAKKGVLHQIDKAIEEMAELTDALVRKRHNRDTAEHVCEEIADVIIMAEQMAIIYGEDKVQSYINSKSERLKTRLAESSKNNG